MSVKLNTRLVSKYVLQHIFLIVAPTLIALFYNVDSFRKSVISFSAYIGLHDFLQRLEIPIVLLFGILAPAIISILNYRRQVREGASEYVKLTSLLVSLRRIVEAKFRACSHYLIET